MSEDEDFLEKEWGFATEPVRICTVRKNYPKEGDKGWVFASSSKAWTKIIVRSLVNEEGEKFLGWVRADREGLAQCTPVLKDDVWVKDEEEET